MDMDVERLMTRVDRGETMRVRAATVIGVVLACSAGARLLSGVAGSLEAMAGALELLLATALLRRTRRVAALRMIVLVELAAAVGGVADPALASWRFLLGAPAAWCVNAPWVAWWIGAAILVAAVASLPPASLLPGARRVAIAVVASLPASCDEDELRGALPGGAETIAAARREWATLDPRSASSSDLAPLLDSLRAARIVLLGEVHEDGASYSQKTRLVRALHEELGFGVIAFETSCFDVWQLRGRWSKLRDASELRASHGSNPLWAGAESLVPLFEYVLSRRDATPPLLPFGLDSKTGAVARDPKLGAEAIDEELGPFLRRIAATLPDPNGSISGAIDTVERMVARLDRFGGHVDPAIAAAESSALEQLGERFASGRRLLAAAHGDVVASFAGLLVRGLRAHAEWYARAADLDPAAGSTFTNPRDAFMAEALQWYLDVVDPAAKVIVWTGGFHGFAELAKLEFAGDDGEHERRFHGVRPLAALLRERFGDAVRVVGCSTWHGETGAPLPNAEVHQGPAPGSIEAALEAAGARVGAIDFRALPADHPLRQPQWCSAMGLEPARADWSRQLDLLLYSRATFLHSARREAGPAVDRIVEGWREVDGRWPRAALSADRLAVVEPLASLLEVATAPEVELRAGLMTVGSLQLCAASKLHVRGDLAGDLHAAGELEATVSGVFLGSACSLGPSRWRFDGPFAGTLRLFGPATVELRCNLDPASEARIVARAPGVVVKLAGYTPQSRLDRLEGALRVELESSDLPVGARRIGSLDVVVARQE